MVADAAVSASVIGTGVDNSIYRLDPLTSLVIVGVIVWGTWSLLRESLAMSISAVPDAIDPQAARRHLESCPGVSSVHDLHIWPVARRKMR